jgi:hypothetical protein
MSAGDFDRSEWPLRFADEDTRQPPPKAGDPCWRLGVCVTLDCMAKGRGLRHEGCRQGGFDRSEWPLRFVDADARQPPPKAGDPCWRLGVCVTLDCMAKGRGLRQEGCRQVISIDPNGVGAMNGRSERGSPCWRAFEAKQPSCSVSGAITAHAKPTCVDRSPRACEFPLGRRHRGAWLSPGAILSTAAGLERALGLPLDLVDLDRAPADYCG